MTNKISDNPSFSNLRQQIQGVKDLKYLLDRYGIVNEEVKEAVKEFLKLEKELQELASISDAFNNIFMERGWIAYETLNFETMKKAVLCAQQGDINQAEEILIDHHNPENIDWKITRLQGIKEFRYRLELIDKAYEDYKAKRYHACIPVILMMIDGMVNDIQQIGFFAENTDLSVWDSIVAHNSGLPSLSKILSQSRKKTTTEQILIPYRNGILHGRDISYDNLVVAAKTWALLFCINDWAIAIRDGKNKALPNNTGKSTGSELQDFHQILKDFQNQQKESEIHKQLLENWKPRKIIVGVDIPKTGASIEYDTNSPEKELVLFFENWKRKNYGNLANQIWDFHTIPESVKKKAGRLRESLGSIEIDSFNILGVDDQAPSITEIKAELALSNGGSTYVKLKTFRLVHVDNAQMNAIWGTPNCSWQIIENFHDLYEDGFT